MQTNIRQWGNSYAIRLPRALMQECALKKGDLIEFTAKNGNIIISPKKYELSKMINDINSSNLHDKQWDNDKIIGKEIW